MSPVSYHRTSTLSLHDPSARLALSACLLPGSRSSSTSTLGKPWRSCQCGPHPLLYLPHSPSAFTGNYLAMKLIKINDFHICLCLCLGAGLGGERGQNDSRNGKKAGQRPCWTNNGWTLLHNRVNRGASEGLISSPQGGGLGLLGRNWS